MKPIAICADMDPLIGLNKMNDIINELSDLIDDLRANNGDIFEIDENLIRLRAYILQYDIKRARQIERRFVNFFKFYPLDLYPRMIDLHKKDKSKCIHQIQILHDTTLTLKIKQESLKLKIKDLLSRLHELDKQKNEDNKAKLDVIFEMYEACESEKKDVKAKQFKIKNEIIEYENKLDSLERAIAFCEYFHKCAIYFKKLPVDVELTGNEPQEPDFHSAKFKAPQIRQIIQSLHARLTHLERLHATSQ